TSGIAKLTLDYSGEQPSIISLEENFVGREHGLSTPNGIRIADNLLYVSDGNAVKRYRILADGSIPLYVGGDGVSTSNETLIWQGGLTTIIDDIMPLCGGIVISDFLAGRIKYIKRTADTGGYNETFTEVWSSSPLIFQSPSAMAIGQPPLFSTEKGLLQEKKSNIGNRLSMLSLPIDLSQEAACKDLAELNN
ncbi:MAG: hypothetical protein HRU22_08670, partial [Gammaproteobacteria bacterium]|nr:hypothetical protein [Gammaproteobacteria bacterium]